MFVPCIIVPPMTQVGIPLAPLEPGAYFTTVAPAGKDRPPFEDSKAAPPEAFGPQAPSSSVVLDPDLAARISGLALQPPDTEVVRDKLSRFPLSEAMEILDELERKDLRHIINPVG